MIAGFIMIGNTPGNIFVLRPTSSLKIFGVSLVARMAALTFAVGGKAWRGMPGNKLVTRSVF
jgi:hypothetical protein